MTRLLASQSGSSGGTMSLVVLLVLSMAPAAPAAQTSNAQVEQLLEALRDDDPLTRRDAAEALGDLGAVAAPAAPHLVSAWRDEDDAVRRQSVAAVKRIGEAAKSAAGRGSTAQDAERLEAVVEALVSALRGSERSQRMNAISIVSAIGRGSEAAYPVMLSFMEEDDPGLRVAALEAMTRGSRERLVRHVREAADRVYERRDESGVRAYRIMMILLSTYSSDFSEDDIPAAVKTLRAGLRRPEPSLRRFAANALGELRRSAAPAIPDLVAALDDPVYEVYEAAGEALENIGPAALPAFAELLWRDDVDLRRLAARAIGEQGPASAQQVDDLLRIATDGGQDAKTRTIAVSSLGKIGSAAVPAVPALRDLFSHENDLLRFEAVKAVGGIEAAMSAELYKALSRRRPERGGAPAPVGDPVGRAERIRLTSSKLVERLEGDTVPVRRAAAEWLGRVLANAGRRAPQVTEVWTTAAGILGETVELAVPALLTAAMHDADTKVRVRAITALGDIGASPDTVLPAATKLFGADDAAVRESAALTVAQFGPKGLDHLRPSLESEREEVRNTAIVALTRLARTRQKESRRALRAMIPTFVDLIDHGDAKAAAVAVGALHDLGPDAADGVRALVGAIAHPDNGVRQRAVRALGAIGAPAKSALPALTKILRNEPPPNTNPVLAAAALDSIAKIAYAMLDESDTSRLSELRTISDLVQADPDLSSRDAAKSLHRTVELLDILSWGQMQDEVMSWVLAHPLVSAAVPIYLAWMSLWWLMLHIRPLALLRTNRALAQLELTLPERLGSMRLPVRYVFFVGFLNYHPRVLDAWVRAHVESIRERFAARETVFHRQVHVPVPVEIDRKIVADLHAKDLRKIFAKQLGFLLIWGEGGSGKTSLACRVGREALSDDPDVRIGEHLMIPVLLEHERSLRDAGKEALPTAVQQQLQDLCDLADPISRELLQNLLRQRRVLVIIDHLSEMSESTREVIQSQLRRFPARALIVTSRLEEDFEGFSKTTVRPLRIAGNRLSSFMEAYLAHRGMRELFDDSEFFRGCSHLSAMVGDRDITALFAKLYAEEMVAAKREVGLGKLPENIPDLMLSYANELNQAVREDKMDDRLVHRSAKLVAWECLRKTFQPGEARYDEVVSVLGGEDAKKQLDYLEHRLRLIHAIQPAQEHIRFLLDPMAEYFAAMYLVESNAGDEGRWITFLEEADAKEGAPDRIKGFLVAVFDCCKNNGGIAVPAFVCEQIAYRAGLETSEQTSRRPRAMAT